MREEKRRKGAEGGTGHSPGILTAWENNGQRDEREERGRGGEKLCKHSLMYVYLYCMCVFVRAPA